MGGLNNRNIFITVKEAVKSKIKVPAGAILLKALSGIFCRGPASLRILPWQRERERPCSGFSSSFQKDTHAIMGARHRDFIQ